MYMHTKKFKILCIDGGGIKGLYSARLLAKFEEVFDCMISDRFDMLCGTSTGGIIALAASLNIPMSDVAKFYQEHCPSIFNERAKHRLDVKGGLVCYWQITKHRHDLTFNEWVDLDLKYIRTRSVGTDLKIIFKAFWFVLTDRTGE